MSPRHKGKKLNALGIMGGDSRDHISGLASLCWFSLCPRTSDFSGPFFFLVSFLCVFFFFSLICKIEGQAGIKIAGRNTNNLRYADDITLVAEIEEVKRLWMKVKEENEKVGLKLKIQKTKIMASGSVTSWQIDGERVETAADFTLLGSKITADVD